MESLCHIIITQAACQATYHLQLFHLYIIKVYTRPKKEEEVLNLEQLERQAVEKAMRLSEGNMTRAAEYLGITRFALYRKIEKLGL